MKNNKYLFILTILFFALSFINIHFALLGFLCIGIPFSIIFIKKKSLWCKGYCPRSSLFTTCGKLKPYPNKKTPDFFTKGNLKWIILIYFSISILLIINSTIGVSMGRILAIEEVRFLFFIPVSKLPQLLNIKSQAWLIHLSYRFFSMLFTTTIVGLILAAIYKPKTWCVVCPVNTVSKLYIK